jgi:hypothetical protein
MIISIFIRNNSLCSALVEAARYQRPENTAVNGANEWITSQWTSAARAADKLVEGETHNAAHNNSDQDAQYHTISVFSNTED